MRARFTSSIASLDGWGYDAGTEVIVSGAEFREHAVPETLGLAWLTSGLLEPMAEVSERADARAPSHATHPSNPSTHASPVMNPRRADRAASRR